MANADCVVIQGSNMAECHPVGFQWVSEAKARGARIIHIDPRFTRTSAIADTHVPLRAGTDVVLLGALINHVLSKDLYFHDYVVAYTNAATLINDKFVDTEDLGGLFSGFDPETGTYDTSSWSYAEREPSARTSPGAGGPAVGGEALEGGSFGGEVQEPGGDEHGASQRARAAGQELGAAGAALEHANVVRDE